METENNNAEPDTPTTPTHRVNPEDIYPTPKVHLNPQTTIPKTPDSMPTNSFIKIFLNNFTKFLVGLVGIGVFGFVLGFITKGPVIIATGYFSELANSFAFLVYVLPLTILFSVIAYVKKDILFAAYPIVIFIAGNRLICNDLVNFIHGQLHYVASQNSFDYVKAAVASSLVFMACYAIERPLAYILRAKKLPNNIPLRIQQASYAAIFMIVILIFLTVPKVAHTLYGSQQRARAQVHVPDTEQLFGTSAVESYNDSKAYAEIEIVYADATPQLKGTYQATDGLSVMPLVKWWDHDTQSNCGSGISVAYFPGQASTYEYKTTTNGLKFAEAKFKGNLSNPPKDSTAFTEYQYCFVLDNQKYVLVRSDASGDAYLKKYSVQDVIDAIAQGQRYIPLCVESSGNTNSHKIPVPFYCTDEDSKRLQELSAKNRQRHTILPPSIPTTGVIKPTIKRSAYTETGRLTIAEWGISLPLSSDIKDAYYVPSSSSGKANLFNISLRSFDSDACFVGTRKDPSGANVTGYGLATIIRYKASEVNNYAQTYIVGTVVGDYVYTVSANANIQKCMDSMQKDASFTTRLKDIFDWAAGGIR